jgi:uroporphyrinogen-III synthase
MARPRQEEDLTAGQDSFLDVITNIVGILIILVMVVGARVQKISLDAAVQAPQAAANGAVWLFSSSQALAHLHGLMPLQKWAHARALATHPRIATALRGAGWGGVSVCKGELAAVLHALENISLM